MKSIEEILQGFEDATIFEISGNPVLGRDESSPELLTYTEAKAALERREESLERRAAKWRKVAEELEGKVIDEEIERTRREERIKVEAQLTETNANAEALLSSSIRYDEWVVKRRYVLEQQLKALDGQENINGE